MDELPFLASAFIDDVLQSNKRELERSFLTSIFFFKKIIIQRIYYNVFEKLKSNDYIMIYEPNF